MKFIGILTVVLSLVAVLTTADLIDGTRKCAGTLYKELIRTQPNQNVLFSPLTVQTLMSMIASGSQNENEAVIQEIRTALSLSHGKAQRETDIKTLFDDIKADNEFKIFDATKMYFNNGYTIQNWYRQIVVNIYKAEFESVNFANSADSTRRINEWVAKKTDNKITNFVNQNDITANTQNVLISTLYLSGKWNKPFLPEHTTLKKFHGVQQTKSVQMMFNNNYTYGYYEDTDAQFLQMELEREEGEAAMIIVLPKKQGNLHSLEQNIEKKLLNDVNFVPTRVSVTLPKFSLSTNMKLKPILQNIGMQTLFKLGVQLSGLHWNGHPLVVVSDVTQKAIMDVNEWGVTAASATDARAIVDAPNNEPKVFTADRPFFFYMTVSHAVVFAGRVMQV